MKTEITHLSFDLEVLTVDENDNIYVRAYGYDKEHQGEEECIALIPKSLFLQAQEVFLKRKKDYHYDFAGIAFIGSDEFEHIGSCRLRSQVKFEPADEDGWQEGKMIRVQKFLVSKVDVELEHG